MFSPRPEAGDCDYSPDILRPRFKDEEEAAFTLSAPADLQPGRSQQDASAVPVRDPQREWQPNPGDFNQASEGEWEVRVTIYWLKTCRYQKSSSAAWDERPGRWTGGRVEMTGTAILTRTTPLPLWHTLVGIPPHSRLPIWH